MYNSDEQLRSTPGVRSKTTAGPRPWRNEDCTSTEIEEEEITHPAAMAMMRKVNSIGLKSTVIASFHPSATNTPYIQSGICATLLTVLRFAST